MNIPPFTAKAIVYGKAHPVITSVIAVLVLYGGYYTYGKLTSTAGEIRYVTATALKGTLVSSLTGTGQVSAFSQIDLKPKAGGDVTYVGVPNGAVVQAGTLIMSLDSTEAQKSVRDAQTSLESARLTLQKLKQPADNLSLIQTQNALTQAKSNQSKAYDDGYNSVSNTFLDLPSVMSGLQDILYGTTVSKLGQDNISAYSDMISRYDDGVSVSIYKNDVVTKYQAARASYDKAFADYKLSSRFADATTTVSLVNEAHAATKTIADAVKSSNDLLNFVKDRLIAHSQPVPAILSTHQTSLSTYTNQTNNHLTDLLNIQNTLISSAQTISEKTESLNKLESGADPLDISSQEISVKQRENALLDAQQNLANYYVRAPFSGTIAKINYKKFDSVGSGSAVATLITKEQMATISLNEVDAARVKIGQKATVTFDAVEDLAITGVVADLDTVGTVTQGVVTYSVKIRFDTQDSRIKPGMSVSSAIITDVMDNVLTVPNSAIKSRGTSRYVQYFDPPLTVSSNVGNQGTPSASAPLEKTVEIGLSNDTDTEIISGLNEGDQIVTRTIAPTAAAQAPSILNAAGVRTGSGNTVRTTTGR